MDQESDLHVIEIAMNDFDLNLIPPEARSIGTKEFDLAVTAFYQNELRNVAKSYNVMLEAGKIRVTWRTRSPQPDALDEAVVALNKDDYARGVEILEMLLPSRSDDPGVHFNLGMAQSDLGRLEEAVRHLRRALALEPSMVNAKVALGVAYSRLKQYEQSAKILREAILDDPENGYALRNLGAVLMQLGHVAAHSLVILAGSASMIAVVALAACLLPAHRAARVSPMQALADQ